MFLDLMVLKDRKNPPCTGCTIFRAVGELLLRRKGLSVRCAHSHLLPSWKSIIKSITVVGGKWLTRRPLVLRKHRAVQSKKEF